MPMSKTRVNTLLYASLALLYSIAIATVIITAHGDATLLRTMTQENGFFESMSVVVLLSITTYGCIALYRYNKQFSVAALAVIALMSLLTFIAGMEEMSWGQHLLHFQSSDFFLQHNQQHETNLHNLVDANLFSSILYSMVYTVFVFIPLLYKIGLHRYALFTKLSWLDLNPHTILVVLFASSFQIYFYDDIGVIVDMFTLLSGLALFGYYLYVTPLSRYVLLHYIVVLGTTAICMVHHNIFDFFNMQYEIREMFVMVAALLLFREAIERYRSHLSQGNVY